MSCVIGIDVGGTKIAAGLVNEAGHLTGVAQASTPNRSNGRQVAQTIGQLANQVRQTAALSGQEEPVAIGIGSAGVVDEDGRKIIASTDAITAWAGTDLADLVEEATDLPVIVQNDVQAHLRGEAWLGAGREQREVIMMAVGTGIGGAIMSRGQILRGNQGLGGDFGHLPVGVDTDRACTCGRRVPHLEALASGVGMTEWFWERGGTRAVKNARDLEYFAAQALNLAGDYPDQPAQLAAQVYGEAGALIGTALGGLANILDPQVVILGGGMARSGALWWNPLRAAYRAQLVDAAADIPLVGSVLGDQAAILGGARLAFEYYA